MEFFLQLVLNGLVIGSIYALVGLGFVIIYKSSSILNFAQGEFLMLGAYVCLAVFAGTKVPFAIRWTRGRWYGASSSCMGGLATARNRPKGMASARNHRPQGVGVPMRRM